MVVTYPTDTDTVVIVDAAINDGHWRCATTIAIGQPNPAIGLHNPVHRAGRLIGGILDVQGVRHYRIIADYGVLFTGEIACEGGEER